MHEDPNDASMEDYTNYDMYNDVMQVPVLVDPEYADPSWTYEQAEKAFK